MILDSGLLLIDHSVYAVEQWANVRNALVTVGRQLSG